MVFNGWPVSGIYIPDMLTEYKELGGLRLEGYVNYHYVRPFMNNTMILMPSSERAIVENIKYNLEFVDEGYFQDALERYQHSNEINYSLLKEVAEFFEAPVTKVDYWLRESSDYNSY